MAKYDLTGSLEKEFTFSIDGREFIFSKPTVREMRAIASKFSAIQAEEDPERQVQMSDEAMEGLYQKISGVGHSYAIRETIDSQPVDVQVAFNKMIQDELGAS